MFFLYFQENETLGNPQTNLPVTNDEEHERDNELLDDVYEGNFPLVVVRTGIIHLHNGDTRTYAEVLTS